MFQAERSGEVHDVVVIGSGAGGGTVTHVLANLGVSVTLLEAGRMLEPSRDYKEHMWPHQVPHRGAGSAAEMYFGNMPWPYFNAPNGYWDIEGEPYTVADGSKFRWFRSRILGGRTNHYGRISLRFADYDFKPRSTDGLGDDWPITYEELAPYYDKAEAFIGVTGTKEGIRSAPDGVFQPPPAPRPHELLVKKTCDKLGILCIPSRMAILTKPLNGRLACHYCGQCGRGCVTASNYSSSQVQIFPAMKTGRVKVITGAMARELITGPDGKVKAVSYVDTATRTERQIRCRTVVVAASACESARLLLNSKSSRFPNGLANNSGAVGRYLTDSVGYNLRGFVPSLVGMPKYDSDGFGGMHMYIPWWLWDKKDKAFPRGYHVEIGGGFGMPQVGGFHSALTRHEGYGHALKSKIEEEYGASVSFSGRGEMVPNKDSFCDIDPSAVDRFGIPVLRFHFAWSDHEIKQARHMHETFTSIIESMGGKVIGSRSDEGISVPGTIIHELGTIRMGNDPKTSPLNKYCQGHDVKNLFVADAAPFVSNPDKNPTLTINAVAWRTAEYLAEEMRKAMSDATVSRRDLVRTIALSVTMGGLTADAAQHVHNAAATESKETGTYTPKCFTEQEYRTLDVLAELIVPGARKAGAKEFIDLLASGNDKLAAIYTGGLAWLDQEMLRRFGSRFADARPEQQTALIDLIAYRKNDSPQLGPGIAFFDWARNMVVDAYYTSPGGTQALGYKGNKGMTEFKVPAEALNFVKNLTG